MTSSLTSDVRETMRLQCHRSVTFHTPHKTEQLLTRAYSTFDTCAGKQRKMLFTSQFLLPFTYIPHLGPIKPIFECKNVLSKFPHFQTTP